MKSKTIISVLLVLIITVSCIGVYAADDKSSPFKDLKNLTDNEATELLKSARFDKDKSFVLVFYKDTCWNCNTFVPVFTKYAKENNIELYGINDTEYPSWNYWTFFIEDRRISFPLVIAYNHQKDVYYSEHTVTTLDSFIGILEKVDYDEVAEKTLNPFTDVEKTSKYYSSIKYLSEKGIINGYSDNTFKPGNPITRAEAAAVIARAANLTTQSSVYSSYSDVAYDYWGKKYIMAATKAGIVNGIGNKMFAPEDNVTHNQIIKMVVCMLSMDDDAQKSGGWPDRYLTVAYDKGIIDYNTYTELYFLLGDTNASRASVAKYVYNAVKK